jgi:hypothetical protein
MEKYKHIISLGFFCSVSSELERIGLRDSSYPFDWLISSFDSVLELINNGFKDFLCLDFMQQYSNDPSRYINNKYNIHFFHDFDKYKKCEEQIDEINNKYQRRIKRFYRSIHEPTLFIRYIKDKNEGDYIELNYNKILNILRKYNDNNDIIFVSTDTVTTTNLNIFKVTADHNDTVAKMFLEKNSELKDYLCSGIYNIQKQEANYKVYKRKKVKRSLYKYPKKVFSGLKKALLKVKIYNSLYYPIS